MEEQGLSLGFLGELKCSRTHEISHAMRWINMLPVYGISWIGLTIGERQLGGKVVQESKSGPRLVQTQSGVPIMHGGHGNGLFETNTVQSRGTPLFARSPQPVMLLLSLSRRYPRSTAFKTAAYEV